MQIKESTELSANVIYEQLTYNPTILCMPLDPNLADFMGAFTEDAITIEDLADEALLSINNHGEVIYES